MREQVDVMAFLLWTMDAATILEHNTGNLQMLQGPKPDWACSMVGPGALVSTSNLLKSQNGCPSPTVVSALLKGVVEKQEFLVQLCCRPVSKTVMAPTGPVWRCSHIYWFPLMSVRRFFIFICFSPSLLPPMVLKTLTGYCWHSFWNTRVERGLADMKKGNGLCSMYHTLSSAWSGAYLLQASLDYWAGPIPIIKVYWEKYNAVIEWGVL